MFSELPLDDRIGKTFFIAGAAWRFAYNKAIGRFALRRIDTELPFERAVELIASGEMLWEPPERSERFGPDVTVDVVQQRVALLGAFRRSPCCVDSKDWMLVSRIDAQLAESRAWLSRRALTSGEPPDQPGDSPD
jgi:hypothetical protein